MSFCYVGGGVLRFKKPQQSSDKLNLIRHQSVFLQLLLLLMVMWTGGYISVALALNVMGNFRFIHSFHRTHNSNGTGKKWNHNSEKFSSKNQRWSTVFSSLCLIVCTRTKHEKHFKFVEKPHSNRSIGDCSHFSCLGEQSRTIPFFTRTQIGECCKY